MVWNNFRLNVQLWELSSCLVQIAGSLKPRLLLSSFWECVLLPLAFFSCVREVAEIFAQFTFFFNFP